LEKGRAFYETCKSSFPRLRPVCDRGLADMEGLHGSELFLQKRYDEAIPFLDAVNSRQDSEVRPEVLYAALMARAQILFDQHELATAKPLVDRALRISAANPTHFPQAARSH
jgi:hypothetical protein